MGTQILTVEGMTCSHCVQAVTAEIARLPGVRHVEVALGTGTVTVETDRTLGEIELAAAVDQAGYVLVPDRMEPQR